MRFQVCLIFLLWAVKAQSESLRSVSDDDLLQLIKDREKLIVLFSKPGCEPCNQLEKVLESLRTDFLKHLSADTVKASNSHLARLYSPTKEPALVFFRHGIPLLYNGNPNEEEVYTFFEQNQTPAVKELTDKIFEHMTQAATGATTGDWFVMFYGASCVECQRLHAVWESVGATLRGRGNVARVDAALAGVNTAKRFKVTKLPAFLLIKMEGICEYFGDNLRFNGTRLDDVITAALICYIEFLRGAQSMQPGSSFRLGKVYRYDVPKLDVKSFVAFATDWYKNAKGDPVPLLASPFDELVDWCVAMLKYWIAYGLDLASEHKYLLMVIVGGFSLVAVTALIALLKANETQPAKAKTEKKSK